MSSIGQHIHGWMNDEELTWLYETGKKMATVVEIGVWKGRSTFALCSSGTKVIAVDHFEGSEEHQNEESLPRIRQEFDANLAEFNNLTLIPISSKDAAPLVGKVDMVFIDGAHDEDSVMQDLTLWAPKAPKIVSGHDYKHEFPAVPACCKKYFGKEPDELHHSIWAYNVEVAA